MKKSDRGRNLAYLLIAIVLSAVLIGLGNRYLTPGPQERPALEMESASGDLGGIEPEESSADVLRSPDAEPVVSGEPQATLPSVAIVMDDCGPSIALAEKVLSLDLPITWAILPGQTYSGRIAKMLSDAGIPFLVHVPMQAEVDPDGRAGTRGMYDIGVGMNDAAVAKALSPLLDAFPGAFGINNHRGSRATGDERVMRAVMDELAKRNLFFLDSNTSTKTLAYDIAKAKGLRTLKNWHFLDNAADRGKIAAEMRATITAAKKRGDTVVICHLRPETVNFLTDLAGWDLPSLGVRLSTLPPLADNRSERRNGR